VTHRGTASHHKRPSRAGRPVTVVCRVGPVPKFYDALNPRVCIRCMAPLPDPQHEVRR